MSSRTRRQLAPRDARSAALLGRVVTLELVIESMLTASVVNDPDPAATVDTIEATLRDALWHAGRPDGPFATAVAEEAMLALHHRFEGVRHRVRLAQAVRAAAKAKDAGEGGGNG